MKPSVQAFFDQATSTASYVVYDREGGSAAIIDAVLDYDQKSGRTRRDSADRIAGFVRDRQLTPIWILETHVHADHLSAAPYLRRLFGGLIGIGEHVTAVQDLFGKIFHVEPEFQADGSQFDRLFRDDEVFEIGALAGRVLHTPGHTPDSVTYVIGDAAFVGDTLFMPDGGTARCDFPGGDAVILYRSIQRLLSLPDETRIFVCHDYAPGGRAIRWETSVAEQRKANIHVHAGVEEDAFVRLRSDRDRTLEMPVLIIPSVQVNMRAGQMPPPEANGVRYLKVPIDKL
jgi:glyoxylase-like metal-dependent hydrolase (beta-lactamase superfamily II)